MRMRVKRRTPSGKVVLMERERRPGVAICAVCKRTLPGMKSMLDSRLGKLSKTEKRPSRKYGGYLCFDCTKELVRKKARSI